LGNCYHVVYLNKLKKKDSDYETVQDILTEYELIVDSYEQARERPVDNEEQKKYYSGKKANHPILDFRF